VAHRGFRSSCRVLTGRFWKRYLTREYPAYTALSAASAFRALVLAFLPPDPLCNSAPALFALIGLQELSLANFDQTLKDMVPEDLLSEPADDGVMEVCADVLDTGLGSSRAASRASSTLERGLEDQETDLDRLAPM
jgi:hypothetical protein